MRRTEEMGMKWVELDEKTVEELEKRMFARLEKTAARAEKIGGGDGE